MSILYYSWFEQQKENPKAIIGMLNPFDRFYVGIDTLTMAIPMNKLVQMIDYMEESFLTTEKWNAVRERIAKSNAIYYFEYPAALLRGWHETDLRMMCVISIDDRINACKPLCL